MSKSPINLTIKSFTHFDRSVFKRKWRVINKDPLTHAAIKVQQRAISLIKRDTRKTKTKTGKKGKYGTASVPPRSPFSRAPGNPLRRIFFSVDPLGRFAIVGPVSLSGGSTVQMPVPALHEFGGVVPRYVFTKVSKTRPKGFKGTKSPTARYRKVRRSVRYPKRPFMKPALQRVAPMLSTLWKNSIRSA